MIYELILYDTKKKNTKIEDMIRPGLFANMSIEPKLLKGIEL